MDQEVFDFLLLEPYLVLAGFPPGAPAAQFPSSLPSRVVP